MLCIAPYRTGSEEFGCGKCLTCTAARRRQWAARLLLELAFSGSGLFVTLTFKEVPDDWERKAKRPLQLYLKRLRKRLGKAFRYFAVGERGSRTARPHYHVALFGVSWCDLSAVRGAWEDGFVDVGDLSPRSAHYVAGYVQKKLGPGERRQRWLSLKPAIGVRAAEELGRLAKEGLDREWIQDVPGRTRHGGSLYSYGRFLRNKARVAAGRSPGTPVSERKRLQEEYGAEDDSERERKRENGYLSAQARYNISLTKEKL